jgi:hypothetical protein
VRLFDATLKSEQNRLRAVLNADLVTGRTDPAVFAQLVAFSDILFKLFRFQGKA